MMAHNTKVSHVVVDAVAFFKNIQLQEFSEKVYTVSAVVNEIRDSATRQRLAVLPYELNYRVPSTESIHFVSDFARKTGEYKSLSATDVQVIALAYQLTKEHVGTEQLRKEPETIKTFSSNKKPLEKSSDIAGFYLPQNKNSTKAENNSTGNGALVEEQILQNLSISDDSQKDVQGAVTVTDEEAFHNEKNERLRSGHGINTADSVDTDGEKGHHSGTHQDEVESLDDQVKNASVEKVEGDGLLHMMEANNIKVLSENNGVLRQKSEAEEEKDTFAGKSEENDGTSDGLRDDGDDDAEDEDGEVDDDVGWITPDNLAEAQREMRKDIMDSLEGVNVGCLTTDFAMQNVLIQIGIPVLSVDGMLIKRAKSFVLRCYACFKTTPDTNKTFCPKCGNKTLMKVSMSVDSEGRQHYHMSNRRPKGMTSFQTNLPAPRGGKHAFNPVVCEDQPTPQNRLSKKAMMRNNVFDPDYVAQNSPFINRDVTSRSAQLGLAKHHQRNANHKKGRRK